MQTKDFTYSVSLKMDDNEPVQKVLNELYEYSTTRDFDTMYCHRLRLNLFYETLSGLIADKTITRFDSALDIGTNAGIFAKMLSNFGYKNVFGLDIDDHQLDKAKLNFASNTPGHSIQFENMNAELLPQDKKYDFIICTEVIEHTKNPSLVIANIKTLLNEGGVAIVSMPNGMSLPFFLSWLGYKLKGVPINAELADHLKYPSYRTLNLFGDSNVKIIKSTGTNLVYWHFYKFVAKSLLFNKLNYVLSKTWPFKYFSQFFFIVLKK